MRDINDLFNNTSLYTKEVFQIFELNHNGYTKNDDEYNRMINCLGFNNDKIITLCTGCNKEFPFKYQLSPYYLDENGVTESETLYIVKSSGAEPGARISTDTGRYYGRDTYEKKLLINKKWFITYYFNCANNYDHKYIMLVSLESNNGSFILTKVGQSPSMLDIHGFDFDKYKKQLIRINAYEDYKKADLSNADHFYVGAYAYLRRIFEKMINKYIIDNDIEICDDHMETKIDKTKQFFDPRVQKLLKNLYGILSISIHELDENESKDYYNYLKAIIDIQLEYEYTEDEKDNQSRELNSIIDKIKAGIKTKKEQ